MNDRQKRGASKDAEIRVAKSWSKWRELTGVICDKKVQNKMKLLIYQTVILRSNNSLVYQKLYLLYG